MNDRLSLDAMTSDQLDQLYEDLDRAEAELRQHAENESADAAAGSYAGRVEELEAALEHTRARLGAALASIRLLRIYANGLDHGHQDDIGPLVASRIRRILAGLDDRPPETAPAGHDHAITQPEPWLHIAFTSPDPTTANTSALTLADFVRAEFPSVRMQITTNAVEAESVIVCTTACDEQHTYDWTCEQFAGIDDSGPADLTGYLAPEPPIGCLTVTAETTPSQRPGLRDDIARAIHRYDREHCLSRNHAPSKDHRGEADAVLTLLYREWPWLRADAEEQQR